MKRVVLLLVIAALAASVVYAQSKVTKKSVEGVTNFAEVESTVACAGAATPASMAEIKKMGYKTVFNLRLPNEQGADIDNEAAAAKTAGINFIHLPFNGAMPDPFVSITF